MTKITIRNIGPIKDVSFNLNKVNVFMGTQGSGKSTIAKIVSYCSWFEKNAIIHPSQNLDFFKELILFHNLEDSYFSDDSRIEYESDACKIDMRWNDVVNSSICFKEGDGTLFQNRKIAYIPAERNFVTLSGLGKYNETRDNILSFMYDWFLAKKDLSEKFSYNLPVKSLGEVSFYYDKLSDSDKVRIEDGKIIKLYHSSSGLRSCIPMLVVFNYIVNQVFKEKRIQTPLEILDIEDKVNQLMVAGAIDSPDEIRQQLMDEYSNNRNYSYSQVIIEEPELNLFPKTQQELMYHILTTLAESERDHKLVITTHSPFILFAVNNCMMGGVVGDRIPDNEKRSIPSVSAWISPEDVSIFEIHAGKIVSIQDEDGLIEDNYLNQAYKDNANEYLSMLNYYDYEE